MNHGLDGWWPWMAEPVREGVEDGIQWQIMANDVLFSWQGYAHIPDGHVRRHLDRQTPHHPRRFGTEPADRVAGR